MTPPSPSSSMSSRTAATIGGLVPSKARYTTIGFAIALAVITYIDRVCIAQAAPSISKDMGLTAIQMGWAFSVFAWAWAFS